MPDHKFDTYETGVYCVFDVPLWRKIHKSMRIDYDKLDVRFHFPTDEEIELASEFIEKYLYSQIDFLKENNSKLTNNQRLKSLTIIEAIGIGSFRLVPPIESQQIQAFESIQSKYQIQYDIFFKPLSKIRSISS